MLWKAVGEAFDQAWAEIASHFASDPVVVEGARIAFCNAILSVASEDSRDVEVLRKRDFSPWHATTSCLSDRPELGLSNKRLLLKARNCRTLVPNR